jgi:sialate O-acetylesterase
LLHHHFKSVTLTMKLFTLSICLILSQSIFAQLRLPSFISSDMVLQQQKVNRIWGWADARQLVTVQFKGKKYNTFADQNKAWQVFIEPCNAGNGGDMVITAGKDTQELKNILIGEVWVCSGQSNMEWTMGMLHDTYKDELMTAHNDQIRFVTVRKTLSNHPKQDAILDRKWSPIDTGSIDECSAVAYWYAKALEQKLNVPIGLVITSWGGTPAQSWASFEGLHDFPDYSNTFIDKIQPLDLDDLEYKNRQIQMRFTDNVKAASAFVHKAVNTDFDDRKWDEMYLPKEWEEQGFPNLDGIVMYRLSFKVDKADAGKAAVLNLPAIDDMDSTFLNGVFIGSIYQWDALRTYPIPAGVLKAGKNTLAIVVRDDGGGGGLGPLEDHFNVLIGAKKIALSGKAKYDILVVQEDMTGGHGDLQHQPAVLYNAMIAPLLPLSIRGAIWYQGESNTDRAYEYRTLFPAMIKDWRNRWGQGDFPFFFVQISSFGPLRNEPGASDWALLREAQTQTLALPNTGMVVTTDIGNPGNIHPVKKKEVGDRLAYQALETVYGKDLKVSSGPQYKGFKIKGNQVVIDFSNIGGGLTVNGPKLQGFSIAGADKKFVWADAYIVNNQVVVSNMLVPNPVAVRYAWADSPVEANLYNKEGFPAGQFRTDVVPPNNPVIAHRGAWKKRGLPENSIASLRAAIELGCVGSEFDVRMTVDDSLVVNHDPHYNKMPIETTRYADLVQYKLSNGEKLPTVREYLLAGLENNSGTKLVCEIKPSEVSKERGQLIAEKVNQLVNVLHAQQVVVFISFDYDILKKIVAVNPSASTQYLSGDQSPAQLKSDGIKGADYHFSVYREHPDWVGMAQQNNIALNAWTVNETADIKGLLDAGFNFITTNEPELTLDLFSIKVDYK